MSVRAIRPTVRAIRPTVRAAGPTVRAVRLVSKERARRRVEREAAQAVAQAKRARVERRRARTRAMVRSMTPRPGRRGRLTGRRSTTERIVLALVAGGLGWVVWYSVESWPVRIAFWLLVVLVLPVFAVVSFDRKGMKL